MKLQLSILILFTSLLSFSQDKIEWISFEEAVEKSKTDEVKKKMFIDVYTDWCGWCKRMDQTTFSDPEVVKYMNENYYCVKIDAERKDTIMYEGNAFVNSNPTGAKREGVHMLAYSLLDGELSYPTYVILDENRGRITIIKGYKQVQELMGTLMFFTTNQHLQYLQYLDKQNQKKLQTK